MDFTGWIPPELWIIGVLAVALFTVIAVGVGYELHEHVQILFR
jgi:hypothetical protein